MVLMTLRFAHPIVFLCLVLRSLRAEAQAAVVPAIEIRAGGAAASTTSIDNPFRNIRLGRAVVFGGGVRLYRSSSGLWGVRLVADALPRIAAQVADPAAADSYGTGTGHMEFIAIDAMGRLAHSARGRVEGLLGPSIRRSDPYAQYCLATSASSCRINFPDLPVAGGVHGGLRVRPTASPLGLEVGTYNSRAERRWQTTLVILATVGF
jgi:hypothetical protein